MGHAQWFAVHPGYGVVVAEMDANGVQTTRTYDDLGRPVTEQPAGVAKTTWSYEQRANGLTVRESDETGASRYVELDLSGRPARIGHVGHDGATVFSDIAYDVLGRLVSQSRVGRSVIDNGATAWIYDSLSRLLRTVEPDGATTRFEHSFF